MAFPLDATNPTFLLVAVVNNNQQGSGGLHDMGGGKWQDEDMTRHDLLQGTRSVGMLSYSSGVLQPYEQNAHQSLVVDLIYQ